jgi:hypothetical protein
MHVVSPTENRDGDESVQCSAASYFGKYLASFARGTSRKGMTKHLRIEWFRVRVTKPTPQYKRSWQMGTRSSMFKDQKLLDYQPPPLEMKSTK